MNGYNYIISKQIQWARNHEIALIGSKGEQGRPAYTQNLDDNLFEPLLPDTLQSFQEGDGNELAGNPAKMQAVHSSSALSVNIFQYWKSRKQVPAIAAACGLCNQTTKFSKNITFEVKYPIDARFQFSPNIDVVIHNSDSPYKVFAIECKFSEAYGGRSHAGIKKKYLDLDIWKDIPNLHELALSISPDDHQFQYLHPAQLIKHILGLKKVFGKTGFRLLYLWYDVLGSAGTTHKVEISIFSEVAKLDNIHFHALSYQDLIIRLADNYRNVHKQYIEYITGRYL